MMKNLIQAFPQHMTEALDIAAAYTLKYPVKHDIHNIVICGMGGSGIGGKLVSQWIVDDCKVPVTLLNDYDLPAFVNEHSLVIGSSYSGNTEETLDAIHAAHSKGAHIIGITSGGEMQRLCNENGYDCIVVPGGNPPRAALAYSLVQLVHIFTELGLVRKGMLDEIRSSYQLLQNEAADLEDQGKKLADYLLGKVVIVFSDPYYEGVAIRARQQFNENSKYIGWTSVIPEMNHNELVGWGGGDERFAPVFLQTNDLNPRNQKRYEITKATVEKKAGSSYELVAKGKNRIERSFYLIHLVDWASWYLAELKGVDAMDIVIIDYLKGELANFQGA
jgi:glucose/mannose-6-phosphate isomerase